MAAARISTKHFDAIKKHQDNLELVGVCDIDPSNLQSAISKYNVRGFSSLTSMLKECNADVYTLCTPSGVHPDQTIEIARAGKHIVSEKPMATNYEDGLRMVDECESAGVQLFVVKQNRHNATLQLLKQAADIGRFGNIYMVNLNVFWTRPQEYYDQDNWRGTWEMDGGAFMNQASHYIDLLDWVIGPIDSIHSFTGTLARSIEAEDTGVINVKWKSGALGSVNVTMLTYPKNLEGSITVLGEKGSVRIGGVAVNEIQEWSFK